MNRSYRETQFVRRRNDKQKKNSCTGRHRSRCRVLPGPEKEKSFRSAKNNAILSLARIGLFKYQFVSFQIDANRFKFLQNTHA